jgi:uncharacterized protein YecE (DUF72 family)
MVLIGTSGWHYPHWKGRLYPEGLPTRKWLEHYSQRFATVEVNNAFYRLPEKSTFESWADAVPEDFAIAVKASRYLTHIRRLREPQEPVRRLVDRLEGLGSKLGPVLLQLPPSLPIDLGALEETLAAFPAGIRVAVEFRHPSWFRSGTRALLEQRNAAFCLTDTNGKRPPLWRTADWGYVRFHHGRAKPESCYGRRTLRTWATGLASLWSESASLYVYFNNDQHGCATRDARWFGAAAARAGLSPTRIPSAREIPVGNAEFRLHPGSL